MSFAGCAHTHVARQWCGVFSLYEHKCNTPMLKISRDGSLISTAAIVTHVAGKHEDTKQPFLRHEGQFGDYTTSQCFWKCKHRVEYDAFVCLKSPSPHPTPSHTYTHYHRPLLIHCEHVQKIKLKSDRMVGNMEKSWKWSWRRKRRFGRLEPLSGNSPGIKRMISWKSSPSTHTQTLTPPHHHRRRRHPTNQQLPTSCAFLLPGNAA